MPTHKQKMVARRLVQREIDPNYQPSNTEIVKEVYKYPQELAEKHSTDYVESRGVSLAVLSLSEEFDQAIPNRKLIRKFKSLLNAEMPIYAKDGTYICDRPALGVQADMLKTGLKMKGALSDSINIDARQVHANVAPDMVNALSSILAGMNALSAQLGLKRAQAQQSHKYNDTNEIRLNEPQEDTKPAST